MKQPAILFCCLAFLIICACSPSKVIKRAGTKETLVTVIVTESYCGGAKPSDSLTSRLQTPHPLPNTILHVKSPHSQIDQIKTDENGTFSLALTNGNYQFFTAEKHEAEVGFYDPEGCKKWKSTPDFELDASDQSGVMIEFHKSCNQCLPPAP